MQINLVSDLNFGKNGTIGKGAGRINRKRLSNPLNKKYEKLVKIYKKQIPILYNTFKNDKNILQDELKMLEAKFTYQIDMVRKRHIPIYKRFDI